MKNKSPNKRGRKLKIFLVTLLLLLLFLLWFALPSLFAYYPAYGGRVMDAETREPLAGAHVAIVYQIKSGIIDALSYPYDGQETITDQEGYFNFEKRYLFKKFSLFSYFYKSVVICVLSEEYKARVENKWMGSSVKSYSKHASVTLKHPVKGDDPSTEIEEYFLEKRKWTLDDICCWDDAHEIARHTGRLENKTPIIYKAASRIENNLNEQCCILSSELRKARREKKKLEGENE